MASTAFSAERAEEVVISAEILAQANAMLDSLGLEAVSGELELEICDMQYQGFEPRMFNLTSGAWQ